MVGASITALSECVDCCLIGSIVHNLLCCRVPCMIILPFVLKIYNLCCLKMAVQPASHKVPMDISDPDASFGKM